MKIICTVSEMQNYSDGLRREGKTIGFVPTMGFLHEGHLSLMRIARSRCDVLVVSIFVNPAQFGPREDFEQYPRDFERDEALCKQEDVDVIFYPDTAEMYPQPYLTFVNVEKLTGTMCGLSRPGHFRGVTTVVTKLFNCVKPHFSVFGQKDYQQALIIKKMAQDLNIDTEIVIGPIIREADGVAMSSRNKYLSETERQNATVLYRSLQLAKKRVEQGEWNSQKIQKEMQELILGAAGAEIDYITIADARTLEPLPEIRKNTLIALAVKIGKTRLIDNILL